MTASLFHGEAAASALVVQARNDPFHRLDAGLLGIDVVGDEDAAAQDQDAVDHLEHVVDVVGDEDAKRLRAMESWLTSAES